MLVYYLFRVGAFVAPFIPVWLGFGLCDLAGFIGFWLLESKRRAVMCNLSHVLPDYSQAKRRQIAQNIFQSNLKNYFDLLRAHKMTPAQLDAVVVARGTENVREAEKLGKGIIACSAHVGSFSLVSQVATREKVNFNLTVEPIKPLRLFELVKRLREVDPQTKLISVSGAEIRNIFRALKRNEMVCLAVDRDVMGNGVPQEFFGATAVLPSGVAEIALRTGAVVMPVLSYRIAGYKNLLEFRPAFKLEATGDHAADIANGNARVLREIEKIIRANPEQWVVLQPIWADCS